MLCIVIFNYLYHYLTWVDYTSDCLKFIYTFGRTVHLVYTHLYERCGILQSDWLKSRR